MGCTPKNRKASKKWLQKVFPIAPVPELHVYGVCCHTVPFLEGSPLHVDVGSARQVDLAGSFKKRSCLLDILRFQVLSVLNTHKICMKHEHIKTVGV